MANTFTDKILGQGQLPNTKGTLYTTPASTQTIISLIAIVNTDVVTRTVNLYVKKSGGTSRFVLPPNMPLGAKHLSENEGITLSAGDLIEGDADTAAVVDYTIHGVEKVVS